MTKKTSSRNPLLIPLIVVLVIAVAAVVLLFMQNSSLNDQVTAVQNELENSEATLVETQENLADTEAELTQTQPESFFFIPLFLFSAD